MNDENPPCVEPRNGNGWLFPDVPNDLICDEGTDCLVSRRRSSPASVLGFAPRSASAAHGDRWSRLDLHHEYLKNSEGHPMYLSGIQRVGLTGGTVFALPAIMFLLTELPNRVDGCQAAMGHFRVGARPRRVRRQTLVTYGQKANVRGEQDRPVGAVGPQHPGLLPAEAPRQVGHVPQVPGDEGRGARREGRLPVMVTSYAYEGDAAWHHDDDEFVAAADQSWSDWRGYGTTT